MSNLLNLLVTVLYDTNQLLQLALQLNSDDEETPEDILEYYLEPENVIFLQNKLGYGKTIQILKVEQIEDIIISK